MIIIATRARPLLALAVLALPGCDASVPPKGDYLRLKAGKDALCLLDRECESNECRLGRCTEKVEKVGQGETCQGNQYCLQGHYCDAISKKCAPSVGCEDLRDRMESCVEAVYVTFRPSQKAKLKRMRPAARKRFLERIHQILYDNLCRATRGGGLAYAKAVKLLEASKQKDCDKFAEALNVAINK